MVASAPTGRDPFSTFRYLRPHGRAEHRRDLRGGRVSGGWVACWRHRVCPDSVAGMDGRAPLAGDWALWRLFAVRSAGFPVGGLEVVGKGDERGRLAEVARDTLFREAVTWQNPAALANAVEKVATGRASKPSRARQREEIVASYWQRYCAKNDTIGF